MEPVNVDAMLARFAEQWSPKRIAQVNNYDVRIVKVQGEFTWHTHPDTDEFFSCSAASSPSRCEIAIRPSLRRTKGVITAAALVMVCVFALFGTLASLDLKQAGVGLAAGAGVRLGLTGSLGNYGSAFITVMFLVGCLVAMYFVDRAGRRPLIIHSFLWAGLALLLLGIFSSAPAWAILVLFAVYAILIGDTQILQWIYPNELFPTEIRGSAVGLASSLSRIGAAIGTYLVPQALSHIGIGPTMIIAGVITLIGAGVSVAWAPETRGLTLGESAALASTSTSTSTSSHAAA